MKTGAMETTFRPVALLMSGRALAFVGTVAIPVVLARVFTQADFGAYKQVFLLYVTFYLLAVSMAESLFYFLPQANYQGGRYAANAAVFLFLAGLGGYACLNLLGDRIAHWMGNPGLSQHFRMLGIYLALTLAAAVLEIVMVSRHRYAWAALSYGLSDLLRAACLIVPVLLFHTLEALLAGAVLFAGVRFVTMVAYLGWEFGRGLGIDLGLLQAQLQYTLPFQASAALDILHSSVHQYAVSARVDAATFAIYAVGCLQLPLVDLVAGPASNVMMVRMGEKRHEGRSDGVLTLWRETTRRLALIMFPIVGCVLVSARELIVLLYTKKYEGSVPIFMLWSLLMLFSVLQVDAVLRVYAETRFLLLLHAAGLVAVVASVGSFLSMFQLPGAVLSTLLATGLVKGLGLLRVRRLLGADWRRFMPWRSLASIAGAAGTAGLATIFVNATLDTTGVNLLLVVPAVFGPVYAAILLATGALTPEERMALLGWLPRRVARLPG
jgi:O-antigen/teichoic acid export membrane protein